MFLPTTIGVVHGELFLLLSIPLDKDAGLLCGNCNPMIGYAKDSVEVLGKAIEYLNSYKGAA